jgi:hypothetical protein
MKSKISTLPLMMVMITGILIISTKSGIAGESRVSNGEVSMSSGSEGTATRSLLRFTAGYSDNPDSFDPFVVYYDVRSTFNFDGQLDALKLFNTDINTPNIYVIENDSSKLSIDAIPYDGLTSSCQIKLGIKTDKNGYVVFRIKDISGDYLGQDVYLLDKVTGIRHNLSTSGDYTVYLTASHYKSRFSLSMGSFTTGIPETIAREDLLKAFSSRGVLNTEIALPYDKKGNVKVYDLGGRVISSQAVNSSGHYEFTELSRDGIYIVTLYFGNEKVSKKIFYRQ